MKKLARSVMSMLLILAMLASSAVTISAALPEDNTIEPQWDSILSINLHINNDDTQGMATGTTRKQSTASRIEAILYVYKQTGVNQWLVIGEASGSKTIGTLMLNVEFTPDPGVYRAVFCITAYTGDVPENQVVECEKTIV